MTVAQLTAGMRAGDRRRRAGARRHAAAVAIGAAVVLGGVLACEAQYLAVFVDGRILPITSASLEGESRIRLGLPNGGTLEVNVTRIDSVIEDALAEEEEPIPEPPPTCTARFKDTALPPNLKFADEILAAARGADLHPELVAAVVRVESAFNPFAISRVGAAGLMQLMPAVWIPAGLATPFSPADNLRVGCRHLSDLLRRYGDLELALAAYNAGAAAVDRYQGVPPYRETREYVRLVLGHFCPAPEPARTP